MPLQRRFQVSFGAALMLALAMSGARAAPPLGADGDADGIPDERDACLYSPRGIVVGPNGCSTPGDEDEDQVADAVDACPQSPPGARVDAQGCALDEDLDGVADGIDRCMSSASGTRVDARGCAPGQVASAPPVRRPAPAPVATAPAPVAIAPPPPVTAPVPPAPAAPAAPAPVVISPSPIVAPVAPGRSQPAPTPAPTSPPKPVAVTTAAGPDRTFYFDPGESDLGWSNSRAVKQSARELMLELESNPALSLVVSGHGDIKFDGMSVPRVSQARATGVRNALIAAGVPAQRVTMRVPGINEPRFYGQDQARNCRVELRVLGRAPPSPVPTVATPAAAATPAPAAPARVFPDPPARVMPDAPALPPPPSSVKPAPPVPAAGLPAQRTLVGTSVKFEPFSSVLDDVAIQALNGFVQPATRLMLADTTSHIVIYSGIGTGEAGATAQRLAESRAGSVASYLVSLGLPHNRMDVSNQTQTGERRVDIRVLSP